MKSFREACFHGIPDEPGLRSTAWKVLMGYLPPDKRMWETTLKKQRLNYYNWVKDLLEEPGEEPPTNDHPLNAEPGSKWAAYFQDNLILEQIDKDVRRTLPDFAFFQQYVPINPLNPLSATINDTSEESLNSHQQTATQFEQDPLSILIAEESPFEKESKSRRFSFGLKGRPRSVSATSKKSLKTINTNNTILNPQLNTVASSLNVSTAAGNKIDTRARSNSRSSARSFSSGILDSGSDIISTPRSIVRKLSTAFTSKSNNYSSFVPKFGNSNKKVEPDHLEPICPYIPSRRSLFRRIAHLNEEIGNREHQNNGTEHHIGQKAIEADVSIMDYHWEVIERILFIYAKLNPGVGYVQGMNELLAPIYYVFTAKASEEDQESQAYAEADSFFVFTTLMADVRDHFVRSLDQDASTGINATMWRMSQRLAWFDRPLFRDLSKKDIKEQYYAFRWITVLCSQEFDLPDVIRLWDSILADRGIQEGQEEGHFEFLLDFTVAMLICIRQELIDGDFANNMRILQNYPLSDIQIVLSRAYSIRETRLQAMASGKIIPGVNDKRSSGLFSGDFSDTSSISSTNSGRFKRFTTDMARVSLDSFRRGSKESLDDIFKRGLSLTRVTNEDINRKRASTGNIARNLSQKLGFANSLTAKVKRTSSVHSVNTTYSSQQQPIDEQIQKDWLLANQLSAAENNTFHLRQNSISSNASSTTSTATRISSLMNRFSQFVSSRPLSSYQTQSLPQQQNEQDQILNNTESTYSSPILSNSLQNNGEGKQLSNVLSTREAIMSTYRGFI
ncbi:rab-GTPase-TBC domain-containing protein [Cokeromyces recurvatus]|uniref:rab-GTPase-TBC domain-containing protein n=1 Tax=Cokeromyces recurvatus TaxID=90255 RepID=UPI002220D142|nr:rab-GTPase-TBC domain-containing protein [Cokeromyces recurvatus]KAI7906962.1 rab-GTPase-TBC domain-containing protein [Cokeromyces recurvatus]